MTVKFSFGIPTLDAWALCHHSYDLMIRGEESVFAKIGLTPQQYWVMTAIKSNPDPVTPTDVAKWLNRNTNSITLIVDRMEKKGLLRKVRDLKDRRSLRLVITPEGQALFDSAVKPAWALTQEMMSCFSEEELLMFISLMGKFRQRAHEYLNPGTAIEEVPTDEITEIARLLGEKAD